MFLGRVLLTLAAVLLAAAPSFAMDVYLVAGEFTKNVNGTPITMWGFAEADAGFANIGPASSPGPVITIPPGDTVLNIYLRNDLPAATGESVSIVIPGQFAAMNPQFAGSRVRSFTHSALPGGGTANYTWNNLRPGTYVYHSGSHPGLQVHMGLYGAVKMDAGPGQAYPNIEYGSEIMLFYSEIDATLHDPSPAVAQPLNYKPAYFLVNGKPYEPGDPNWLAGAVTQNILIRFVNAGLKTHVPTLRGGYWKVVAEDGNPYTYPKQQYSVLLPAMKTMDVIWNPGAEGVYPVYDARYFLTTNQVSGGGMLVNLEVGEGVPGPIVVDDAYETPQDTVLEVPAPGVLGNDTGLLITAELVTGALNGVVALNPDGSFTYTPDQGYSGPDTFTYRAFDGAVYSATNATVSITVTATDNNPPIAVDDNAITRRNVSVFINLTENDYDPDGNLKDSDGNVAASQISLTPLPSGSNSATVQIVTNGVIYTPARNFTGTDTFRYTVTDLAGNVSNEAIVTVRVVWFSDR
ncbi:MAG: hypothetical protein C4548_09900 [Desulfobacteraceae bacterium]|nr:MAG: hypothetical protein C4548_09900 [Desulfobacteraceae bacterium]